jgi:hypothetical protein
MVARVAAARGDPIPPAESHPYHPRASETKHPVPRRRLPILYYSLGSACRSHSEWGICLTRGENEERIAAMRAGSTAPGQRSPPSRQAAAGRGRASVEGQVHLATPGGGTLAHGLPWCGLPYITRCSGHRSRGVRSRRSHPPAQLDVDTHSWGTWYDVRRSDGEAAQGP